MISGEYLVSLLHFMLAALSIPFVPLGKRLADIRQHEVFKSFLLLLDKGLASSKYILLLMKNNCCPDPILYYALNL
jgi:hypothetical protein